MAALTGSALWDSHKAVLPPSAMADHLAPLDGPKPKRPAPRKTASPFDHQSVDAYSRTTQRQRATTTEKGKRWAPNGASRIRLPIGAGPLDDSSWPGWAAPAPPWSWARPWAAKGARHRRRTPPPKAQGLRAPLPPASSSDNSFPSCPLSPPSPPRSRRRCSRWEPRAGSWTPATIWPPARWP